MEPFVHRKWIWIPLALAALFVGVRLLPVNAWSTAFIAWVQGTGLWGPIVLSLAYIPATLLFVPGSILTVGAGYAFGIVVGTALVSIGSVVGTNLAFLLGRTLFRRRFERIIAESPRWRALDDAVERDGFKIVLLMRLSPAFPYNLMGYVFGVTKVRFKDHFFASWIGMFPGTVMYVYLGCAAQNLTQLAAGQGGQRSPAEWAVFGLGLLATVAVTVVVTKVARRAIRDAAPALAEDDEGGAPASRALEAGPA